MSSPQAVPLHEVERLIKQLENPIRSAKIKASEQLVSIPVYPTLIPKPDQFLHEVVTPLLRHFANDTECVRENCVKTIGNYANELGTENLQDTLSYVLPPLFARLKDEEVEPAEQIRLALMKLLLQLIRMVTATTVPDNWNAYADSLVNPLTVAFKSSDADMKKCGCEVLNEALTRCSQDYLSTLGISLSKFLIPNCSHRHFDVRRMSLNSLAVLSIASGVVENVDKLSAVLQKLTDDRNSNVRKAVIAFCKTILTDHVEKKSLYHPILIPLLVFIRPLVPLRPLEVDAPAETVQVPDEAQLAFNALNEIGEKYGESEENGQVFDDSHVANGGIVKIIRDYSEKMLESLLPMMIDWTETRRNYGYAASRSFLQLCGPYIQRYVPHILQRLTNSLRDMRGDTGNALQCQAILSSYVPGKDIVDFLLPKIVNEGPKEIILLLTVASVNGSIENNQLEAILEQCMKVKVFEALECVGPLVQFALAIIRRSAEFANANAVSLLVFILKLCEKTDALKCFIDAFGRPIAEVFAEKMAELLKSEDKTPEFLTHLLLTAPAESVKANQEIACTELSNALESDPQSKSMIEILITKLADKGSFENVSFDFIQKILDDMVWCAGKDKIPFRENATYALAALIRSKAINDETLTSQIDKILPMILSSLDDSWANVVRVSGSECMYEFTKRSTNDNTEFEKIYPALKERLDDHVLEVRVMAAKIFALYLPKCVDNASIPEKWNELFIFIDDENEAIRNSIADLIRTVASVPSWKESVLKNISEQNNYHQVSTELCQSLVTELQ